MEKKEFAFNGSVLNGFVMLVINILLTLGAPALLFCMAIREKSDALCIALVACAVLVLIFALICWRGFMKVEPGESRVLLFFGKYRGTFSQPGYYWVNPLMSFKKLSLRARNLDGDPIKVNDKSGNPVMIGMVLVWKLEDTYRAMFDIDAQTMAQSNTTVRVSKDGEVDATPTAAKIMNALEQFVKIQADAALRQVAGKYAYDNNSSLATEITLRDGGDEINKELEARIADRLVMAGIKVVEARINYLAYSPEIAAVMLRRQQADAIIAAREKIVEGAVSMVEMALKKLSEDEVVELDEDKKATMVSNLLVVLCADDSAKPVVNTGTLNM